MISARSRRRGFTLIELLVVTAVMALLFGLVLSGARPGTAGQIRQAAQSLASAITATQSRALGNPAGAALILESGTSAGLSIRSSIRMSNGDLPPFITGTSGTLTTITATTATVSLAPTNGDAADLQHGYKIRFGGAFASRTLYPYQPPTTWFALGVAATGTAAVTPPVTGTVGLRVSAGQNTTNTIWPEPTITATGSTNPLDFQVARYPGAADLAVELPKSVAINLQYSGVGDDPTTTWGGLANDGAIAVVFDSVGGVDAVMQQALGPASLRGPQPIDPVEPLYLLVSSRNDVEQGIAAPLSNPDDMWIAIHPQTGRVTVAPNVQQSGTTATAVRAARAKARALVTDRK
jgi:prepilin-type N-terminal cleavage/methylation domain-containing protein